MMGSVRQRSDRGFARIEGLTVLMILSVLVRVGIPSFQGLVLKAAASRVVSEMDRVRRAAHAYQADYNAWPRDVGPGLAPPELVPYLDGLSFSQGRYQLDWQLWPLPGGLPWRPDSRQMLAISIITPDRRLGAALVEHMGSNSHHFALGDTYTFVVEID